MIYGSVCSGIEAASVAWKPLGWSCEFVSEVEAFPCAVLVHHYPQVKNFGDVTCFHEWPERTIDLLVGGTPCQSFSVAGLRKGLDDPRGNLTLTYLAVADRYRPRWVVWENVPGILSDATGAFGAFLGGLAELGYGFAYRVLDAQHFGVPQRRRRVFVVGYLGDWRPAAAVLFESHSLSGHPPPRREAGQGVALPITSRVDRGGEHREAHGNNLVPALTGSGRGVERVGESRGQDPVIPCLRSNAYNNSDPGMEASMLVSTARQTGQGFWTDDGLAGLRAHPGGLTENLIANVQVMPTMQNGADTPAGHSARSGNMAYSLRGGRTQSVATPVAVRRLTPRECERLQGFPDDYTLIPYRGKPACDGPRYKALGNSMAVPVMRWIGERIKQAEAR